MGINLHEIVRNEVPPPPVMSEMVGYCIDHKREVLKTPHNPDLDAERPTLLTKPDSETVTVLGDTTKTYGKKQLLFGFIAGDVVFDTGDGYGTQLEVPATQVTENNKRVRVLYPIAEGEGDDRKVVGHSYLFFEPSAAARMLTEITNQYGISLVDTVAGLDAVKAKAHSGGMNSPHIASASGNLAATIRGIYKSLKS